MSLRKLGFSFVKIADIKNGTTGVPRYTHQQFVSGMFQTPPFPSTCHYLMPQQDWGDGTSGNAVMQFILNTMADVSGSTVRMGIGMGFDVTVSGSTLSVQNLIATLSGSANRNVIGFIGVDHEHLRGLSGMASNSGMTFGAADNYMMQLIQGYVGSAAFTNINNYQQGFKGTTAQKATFNWFIETNYPLADNQGALKNGTGIAYDVGIMHGFDVASVFPSNSCVAGNGTTTGKGIGMVNWTLSGTYLVQGWDAQLSGNLSAPVNNIITKSGFGPTIQQCLSVDASQPFANRQWCFFIAGNKGVNNLSSNPEYSLFAGVCQVSGTSLLWDHSGFRMEIQAWLSGNPNMFAYNNFALNLK